MSIAPSPLTTSLSDPIHPSGPEPRLSLQQRWNDALADDAAKRDDLMQRQRGTTGRRNPRRSVDDAPATTEGLQLQPSRVLPERTHGPLSRTGGRVPQAGGVVASAPNASAVPTEASSAGDPAILMMQRALPRITPRLHQSAGQTPMGAARITLREGDPRASSSVDNPTRASTEPDKAASTPSPRALAAEGATPSATAKNINADQPSLDTPTGGLDVDQSSARSTAQQLKVDPLLLTPTDAALAQSTGRAGAPPLGLEGQRSDAGHAQMQMQTTRAQAVAPSQQGAVSRATTLQVPLTGNIGQHVVATWPLGMQGALVKLSSTGHASSELVDAALEASRGRHVGGWLIEAGTSCDEYPQQRDSRRDDNDEDDQ